jgi:hypothetical protein
MRFNSIDLSLLVNPNPPVLFSLTLPLSRWEREQPLADCLKFGGQQAEEHRRFTKRRGAFLPLPAGEGRGEGQRLLRESATFRPDSIAFENRPGWRPATGFSYQPRITRMDTDQHFTFVFPLADPGRQA